MNSREMMDMGSVAFKLDCVGAMAWAVPFSAYTVGLVAAPAAPPTVPKSTASARAKVAVVDNAAAVSKVIHFFCGCGQENFTGAFLYELI